MSAPEESRLSATLIARDGADRLPDALASVAFADECVVVVEAASADRLEEVARRSGARVFVRPFEGFGRQKNAAASLATNRWILSLDADETVSPNLAREIRSRLATAASATSSPAAFRVPVRLAFFGRELLFGRDTVVRPARLYDRTRARFSDDPVGEEILAAGPIDSLEESILHRPHRDLADYLEKLDRHTTLAAEAKWAAGKRDTGFPAARVLWEFFDRALSAPRLPRRHGRPRVRGPLVRDRASDASQAARAGAGDRPRRAQAARRREERRRRGAPGPRAPRSALTATSLPVRNGRSARAMPGFAWSRRRRAARPSRIARMPGRGCRFPRGCSAARRAGS